MPAAVAKRRTETRRPAASVRRAAALSFTRARTGAFARARNVARPIEALPRRTVTEPESAQRVRPRDRERVIRVGAAGEARGRRAEQVALIAARVESSASS